MHRFFFCSRAFCIAAIVSAVGLANAASVQVARLEPVVSGQQFGRAVAVSGDVAAVGATFGDTVFTYGRDIDGSETWGLIGTVTIDHPGAHFGRRLALDAGLLAVAAPDEQTGATTGSVFLYQRDVAAQNGWRFVKKLPDPAYAPDVFGGNVAIDGDRVVVTGTFAPGDPTPAVFVLQRDLGGADNWGLEARLVPEDIDASGDFGQGLAIDVDIISVGSPLREVVEIYSMDSGGPGNWGHVQTLSAQTGFSRDYGYDLSLHSNRLLVTSRSVVRAYFRDQGGANAWGEIGLFDANEGTFARDAVAYSTGFALSSETGSAGAQENSGAAFLFAPNRTFGGRTNWLQVEKIFANDGLPQARFAQDMDVDGTTLIVGAPSDSSVGSIAGVAYIFELDLATDYCDLLVEPPADYGGVPLGTSASQTLSIRNVGNVDCDVFSVVLTGDGDFYMDPDPPALPVTLAPGSDVALNVVFEPAFETPRAASVTLTGSDAGELSISVPLNGEGIDPGCALVVTYSGGDLVNVPVGTALSDELELVNTGFETCEVTGLDLFGDTSFTLATIALPLQIARGDAASVLTINYLPTDIAEHSATLAIAGNDRTDPVMQFDFAGNATVRCNLIVDPATIDYGLVPLGDSATRQLALTLATNPRAAAPCTIIAVQTLNNPPFDIPSSPATGRVLLGGESTTAQVRFSPLTAHSFSGLALVGTDDPMQNVFIVPLTGVGHPDSDLDGVPNDIDNCVMSPNASQFDSNGDGFGNICDQDLNNDCVVNAIDLGIFRGLFFMLGTDADFNGDGVVGTADLGLLRLRFFNAPGPSALADCG